MVDTTTDGVGTPQRRVLGGRVPFGGRPAGAAGAAVKRVADNVKALVRAEIELAKAELMAGLKPKALGAGLLAGAGVLAAIAFLGLLLAAGFALSEVGGLPGWASALIVSGVLIAVAVALVLVGRARLRTAIALDTTKANVQEDVAWTKSALGRK